VLALFISQLCAGCATTTGAQADLLSLNIGQASGAHSRVEVSRDTIVDTAVGTDISPRMLAERARGHRLVLVGEEHTDADYHDAQLRVLEILHGAGIPLLLGLEMFPAESQPVLDRWTRGEIEEADFVASSDWYRVWGYHWGYYREIFAFARTHGIRIVGLDSANEAASDQTHAPGPSADLDSNDHRTLVRAFFGADSPVHGGMSPEQFDRLFEAQARRDAVMAAHAAAAMDDSPDRTMVVLAGVGHVLYELGIVRQLPARYSSDAITIVPVPVPADQDSATVSASVADFVWGVPHSDWPKFPELGVITVNAPNGLHVIDVASGTPAEAAGIQLGDTLTAIGGSPLGNRIDLSRLLSSARWGDVLTVAIERDGERLELAVPLHR